MDHTQTEAARRAIRLAAQLAAHCDDTQITATHLFRALVLVEGRAAEVLEAHGISDADPLRIWRLDLPRNRFTSVAELEAIENTPAPGEEFVTALNEASQQAGLAGRHAALGTEHLLFGLARANSVYRNILESRGLTDEVLAGLAGEQSGFSSEPIDVEVNLQWAAEPPKAHETLRILDAAANRAREGLRVLEDYVRFSLDDAHLTERLKICRHGLSRTLASIDPSRLLAARDTAGDVGARITTESEGLRAGPLDVVQANFKRVQEALRSLEEFGKVVSPSLGATLESVRYELYLLERAVLLTVQSRRRLEGRGLYLLVTEEACHHGAGPAVREALAAGAGIVQVREKSMPDRLLLDHARRVRQWTEEASALFIVNDRPDIAVLANADGVHVGQDELSVRDARRIMGAERLVGVSTHSIEQARKAVLDGADYIGVGPVFPSATKSFDQLAGLDLVRAVAAEISLPWFAIGGIDEKNVAEVVEAGATRIAVSSAVCGAGHPGQAAAALLHALRGHTPGT